jgi:hypothetical protein
MRLFAPLLTLLATPRFTCRAVIHLAGAVGLALAGSAMAQAPATAVPTKATPLERTANTTSKVDPLIETIQVDAPSARIDEQRFGGETRSISVAPKGGFPAYDVQPQSGVRSWKILGF